MHHFNRPKISNNSLIRDQKSNKHIANGYKKLVHTFKREAVQFFVAKNLAVNVWLLEFIALLTTLTYCICFLFWHPRSFYIRICSIYPAAEFVFVYIASIVVYWPTFSLMFLIHLFLYAGVYRTLKSESEGNTLNYSQSDHA